MAALSSPATSTCLAVPPRLRRRGDAAVPAPAALGHGRRGLVALPMSSSGMGNGFPVKRVAPVLAVGPEAVDLSSGSFPIPDIPSLISLLFGAVVFAVPMYRRIRDLEEKLENTAKVAIDVVDSVAEATEKVAVDIADAFPENENIKKAAAKIKNITDEIEEDADKAEALLDKVDEIKRQVDSVVEPIIDKAVKK